MYKNKSKEKLARLIRQNKVPGYDEVDWAEVYSFWLKNHDKVKKEKKVRTIDQIYDQRARTINYRAKKKGVEGIVLKEDLFEIMANYNNQCKNCSKTEHLVFDHIIPMYRGGLNIKENLQVLCRLCNMEKGVSQ